MVSGADLDAGGGGCELQHRNEAGREARVDSQRRSQGHRGHEGLQGLILSVTIATRI